MVKRVLSASLVVSIVIVTGVLVKEVLPNLPKMYAGYWLVNEGNNGSEDREKTAELESAETIKNLDKDYFLQRQDVIEGKATNTRSKIWMNYIKGLEGRYIIGASPRNVEKYMKDNHPDIYKINNRFETHNGYLSVFVGTGIIGLGIILLFMILMAKKIFKYFFGGNEVDGDFLVIFTIILIILIYTFFFTELFFVSNLTTVIFWCLLGASVNYVGGDCELKIGKYM